MPLSRDTITHSSRVMLVVYPVFSILAGLSYLLGDPSRTDSPSFDVVRHLAPLPWWGVLFIALGLLETLAWAIHRRSLMVGALRIGMAVHAMWTFGFLASLVDLESWPPVTPGSSFNAVWLWAFVTFAHLASLESLNRDSVDR